MTSFRERVLPLGLGLDLRHHVWLVDPHPLQGRRPNEVGPLDPLQQGELLSVFSVSSMALNGGGHVSHEYELGGEQSRRRIPA